MVDLKEYLFQGLDECLTERNINSCANVAALSVSVIHGYMELWIIEWFFFEAACSFLHYCLSAFPFPGSMYIVPYSTKTLQHSWSGSHTKCQGLLQPYWEVLQESWHWWGQLFFFYGAFLTKGVCQELQTQDLLKHLFKVIVASYIIQERFEIKWLNVLCGCSFYYLL